MRVCRGPNAPITVGVDAATMKGESSATGTKGRQSPHRPRYSPRVIQTRGPQIGCHLSTVRLRGLEPYRHVARMHGCMHDCYQIGRQQLELDFIPQPPSEGIDCLLSVVTRTVEATVDRFLDAGTQGAERRNHGKS